MALNVAMGHPKDSREQQIVMISAIYHEKCNIGRNPLFYNTKDNQEHQFCGNVSINSYLNAEHILIVFHFPYHAPLI